MTHARIAELRALADAMGSRVPEDDDRCVKCNESMAIGDGMEPSPLCHLCAQEVAESLPELLAALAECDLAPHEERAGCFCSSCLLHRAEAVLEVAREALEFYVNCPPIENRKAYELQVAALAKLPPKRSE